MGEMRIPTGQDDPASARITQTRDCDSCGAASNTLTTDPSPSDCGHACHVALKAKDYIIHPYQKR